MTDTVKAGSAMISDRIRNYCHAHKLPIRPNRGLVADTLQAMNREASADDIWENIYLSGRKISLAGVYICLNWLIGAGFVEKVGGDKREKSYRLCA